MDNNQQNDYDCADDCQGVIAALHVGIVVYADFSVIKVVVQLVFAFHCLAGLPSNQSPKKRFGRGMCGIVWKAALSVFSRNSTDLTGKRKIFRFGGRF